MSSEIFKLQPPESPKGAYIKKPQVLGNQISLIWVCYRRGKNYNGYTAQFEEDPTYLDWDKFSKKSGISNIPTREIIQMDKFQKWNPKKIRIPESVEHDQSLETLYKQWAYIAIKLQSKDADREKTESLIHEQIYTPEMFQDIIEIRYNIAKELLSSDIFEITSRENYIGPNISEIRNQCEQYIDSGMRIMHKFLKNTQIEKKREYLFEWEQHLIDKTIERLDNWDFVCETLQIPEPLKQFFNFIEITSSWKNLSPAMQSMFQNALKKSEPKNS
jgi:hypothetical protein